jgi:hypothetical protein
LLFVDGNIAITLYLLKFESFASERFFKNFQF